MRKLALAAVLMVAGCGGSGPSVGLSAGDHCTSIPVVTCSADGTLRLRCTLRNNEPSIWTVAEDCSLRGTGQVCRIAADGTTACG